MLQFQTSLLVSQRSQSSLTYLMKCQHQVSMGAAYLIARQDLQEQSSCLLTGGSIARSEANARTHTKPVPDPQAEATPRQNHTPSASTDCSLELQQLQQLALCAGRISQHTAEAKHEPTVSSALSLWHASADASPLAKRLSLCVLGVDVDVWISNWSNLYQLDGMRIGKSTPDLFLGHSIGPQLGTAAVILQPDKSCYHVDWYIPGRLAQKLVRHGYWARLLPGSTWL